MRKSILLILFIALVMTLVFVGDIFAQIAKFAVVIATPQQNNVAFVAVSKVVALDSSNLPIPFFDASANPVTVTPTGALSTGVITGLGTGGNNVIDQAFDVNGEYNLAGKMIYTGPAGTGGFLVQSTSPYALGASNAVTINPGPLNNFLVSISGPEQNTIAFVNSATVTARDISNNVITNFDASADNVTITASTGGTITGLGSGNNNVLNQAGDFVNGVADLTAQGMTYTGQSGFVTFTATSASGKVGSDGATINPGPLNNFAFVLASPQQNSVAFTGTNTLTARDVSGNTITTFNASTNNVTITHNGTGTITGLGSGNNNVLNQAGDFVNGVANLTGKMKFTGTSGSGITFTATSADGKSGNANININPGPLDHFSFSVSGPQTNDVAFVGVNTLTARDVSNNIITTFNAAANNVTVTASTGGTVSGLGSANNNVLNQAGDFVNGVADLTAQGMKYTGTSGSGITFTATSGGKTGVSNAITINPGALNNFLVSISGPEQNTIAFVNSATVTARDISNNVITNFDASADNVTITASTGGTITG
ncbi:MAG: beta strand repeat-containing protein, partial [bacterium]